MEIWLPTNKLNKAKLGVIRMLYHDVIEYDDLQSLTSFLFFAAKVVWPGRIFLHHLFDVLAYYSCHICIYSQIKADLKWENYFLP